MTLMAVRPKRAVRVGLDGTGYEIGRTAGHARALRDTWRAAWPPPGGRRPAQPGCRASVSGLNPTAVREWARAQGTEVKDRGRVPAERVARFKAATAKWARQLRPPESRQFHSHAEMSEVFSATFR